MQKTLQHYIYIKNFENTHFIKADIRTAYSSLQDMHKLREQVKLLQYLLRDKHNIHKHTHSPQ